MRKVLLFLLISLIFSACAPAPLPTETPATSTPAPSPTPTATIIWFPATETPTATPEIVQSPTPDLRTGLGALILEENFDAPEDWHAFPVENGSATVANNHLTMVLTQAKQYSYASHTNLFIYNFYGEITATPNICEDLDEYGIIIRSLNLSDFYRMGITCGGMVRVDRVTDNLQYSVISSRPVAFQQTGPPVSVKIGVWAKDTEIRFFINDQFLFSITDHASRSGSFGTFIHSVGDSTISVNFTELNLWEVD